MNVFNFLIKLLPSKLVHAHCDVPCGIYDPRSAQIAAATVLKMVQKIKEYPEEDLNNRVRAIATKEEYAQICKKEILILWTDYFKSEHLEKFPDLHDLIWKTTKLCSYNKRSVDEAKAKELVEEVDKVADIFNHTKK